MMVYFQRECTLARVYLKLKGRLYVPAIYCCYTGITGEVLENLTIRGFTLMRLQRSERIVKSVSEGFWHWNCMGKLKRWKPSDRG
jgi:hypothetical protein